MIKKTLLIATAVIATIFAQTANAQRFFSRVRPYRAVQIVYPQNTVYYRCSRCGRYHAYPDRPAAPSVRKAIETPRQIVEGAARTLDDAGILSYANSIRARYGLRPLALDINLQQGSTQHCKFMASWGRLQHASGYAEIIAMNSVSYNYAFSQWLNSPAHRNILLSSYYTRAGFSSCRDGRGVWWSTMRFR